VRRRVSPAFVAVLGLSGFLLLTAVSSARTTKRVEAPRKAELVHLIEQRQSDVDRLDERVRRLRDRVTAAERVAARRSQLDSDQARALSLLAAQAGTTALKGPGVEVRLSDSDRSPPSPDAAGAYRIHDNDLQLVVNALFGAGAEAVAVNGNRVVVTTPIRAAGDTIVVNFRPLNPPYRVVAIGADREAFGRSEIAGRFRRWTRLFGLGFSTRSTDDASVPAYTGRVQITSANPATEVGGN
jgi:uncharacterized protein YlxW (UPF0749 family)